MGGGLIFSIQFIMPSQQINGDTPVFHLTVSQLIDLLKTNIAILPVEQEEPQYVYGIKGLCSLLNCSHPTANKIKKSGKIPFVQIGRKLVFERSAVLKSLETYKSKTRNG